MTTPATPAPEPAPGDPGGLMALGAELEGVFDRLARRQGNLTLVQYRVLDLLTRRHPDPVEPLDLARTLTMGSNHVTMVLDQLQDRGLVERRAHPHDGRRRLVSATDNGRAGARRLGAHVAALEERIMGAALTPGEGRLLGALAGSLRRTLADLVVPDARGRPGP
jgi:DNA-binding MarR family transcriptional regulator